MRNRLGLTLAGLAIAALGLAVLAVFMGRGALFDRGLTAQVVLQDFRLPADYSVDPLAMSDALVDQMLRRTQSDVALRLMLEQDSNALLTEVAIPRLVNAGVMRRIFDEMPGIGTVIAMPDYHALSLVMITNHGAQPLEDVALTLPGPIRAEGALVHAHDHDLSSITLPALAPGATAAVTVWHALPTADLRARSGEIRLAARGPVSGPGLGPVSGQVQLYASATGWHGADLQARPWARWTAAALVAAVTFLALAGVVIAVGRAVTHPAPPPARADKPAPVTRA